MNAISENRPQRWNEVLGQTRVIAQLHGLLRRPQFMTRGYIFEGPWGVGKTSTAYLFADALLCLNDDPLNCGHCAACRTLAESRLIQHAGRHPAFTEINAAQYSGVAQARELIATLDFHPVASRRAVVMVDEAHRLSEEAFDVFLKPLEEANLSVAFLFVTTDLNSIPKTVVSRCAVLRFLAIEPEEMVGRLMTLADAKGIAYTSDGLKRLAAWSEGRPRDAEKGLNLLAAVDQTITPECVDAFLNQNIDQLSGDLLRLAASGMGREAIAEGDNLAQRIGPVRAIASTFSRYVRDLFNRVEANSYVDSFAPYARMTEFFLKWSVATQLPADVMPLFVAEMCDLRPGQGAASVPNAASTQGGGGGAARYLTSAEFNEIAG